MKLEQQVCSLELSKRLRELGVKQESIFRWNESDGVEDMLEYIPEFANKTHELVSAFTVAELGEMLPWHIEIGNRYYILEWEKGGMPWHWISYRYGDTRNTDFDIRTQEADTESDARAKILIYLIEKGLFDVKTLNKKDHA